MGSGYRFSFGPWNIGEGADPFGPVVRDEVAFGEKLKAYQALGFEGVQFHDDDAVPDLDGLSHGQVMEKARAMKGMLDDHGLVVEFVAPRLWEDARGIDGGFTNNTESERRWAIDRTKVCADIAAELETDFMVVWYAREGTYIREAKSAIEAHRQLIDAMNEVLEHRGDLRIAIEPKPNEPMDHNYIPTVGHAVALGQATVAPDRMGTLIETAHSLLAGLDASDDMAFALALGKLWSVHLNDQNGLKYDQDKSFGSANLRVAFNQVRVLEEAGYAETGYFVGLDVKAMRTQKAEAATKHLSNSKRVFEHLVEKVRTWDKGVEAECVANRDYEELDLRLLEHLMGV